MSFFGDLLGNLFPSKKRQFVQVFDPNLDQVFKTAQCMEVRRVEETSQLMDHTIETGAVITDYRIINPVGIEIIYILNTQDFQSVYSSIKKYFINGTLFTVQTKTGVYKNQVIKDMPHTETSEMYNAIAIVLSFRQAQFVSAQYGVVPVKPSNKTTVNRGTIQNKTPNASQVANATSGIKSGFGFFSKFGNIFN